MRIICLASLTFLLGCVDLSTICPYKAITQGVFGEIVDSSNTLEQNIQVDVYNTLNGMQYMKIGTAQTTRGGYEFFLNPAPFIVCAKTVCTNITAQEGLLELSAVDAAPALTWDAPVTVPPEQMIGPCKYGN